MLNFDFELRFILVPLALLLKLRKTLGPRSINKVSNPISNRKVGRLTIEST